MNESGSYAERLRVPALVLVGALGIAALRGDLPWQHNGDPAQVDNPPATEQVFSPTLTACASERMELQDTHFIHRAVCRPAYPERDAKDADTETHVETAPILTVMHTVQKGEYLTRIAHTYNLSLDSLLTANPHLKAAGNVIMPGQDLTVQFTHPVSLSLERPTSADTIAKEHDLEAGLVALINTGKASPEAELHGQVLLPLEQSIELNDGQQMYYAKPQDTLFGIAKQYKVSLLELVRQNAIGTDLNLMPGMSIVVPKQLQPAKVNQQVQETQNSPDQETDLEERLKATFLAEALQNTSPLAMGTSKEDGEQVVDNIDKLHLSMDAYRKFKLDMSHAGIFNTRKSDGTARGPLASVDFFVAHYDTVDYKDADAIIKSLNDQEKSVHFWISKKGTVFQLYKDIHGELPPELGHARGLNNSSLGVEIAAKTQGDISPKQMEALAYLMLHVKETYPSIPWEQFIGHAMMRQNLNIPAASPRADWKLGPFSTFMFKVADFAEQSGLMTAAEKAKLTLSYQKYVSDN